VQPIKPEEPQHITLKYVNYGVQQHVLIRVLEITFKESSWSATQRDPIENHLYKDKRNTTLYENRNNFYVLKNN